MKPLRSVEYGGPLHRIANKPISGHGPRIALLPDHPATRDARTLFPSTVVDAKDSPRLLVSGVNQRKIGRIITKGRWKGFSLYTLTLEERATCPRTCLEWSTCYGNNMHLSRRHRAGLDLEARLISEIVDLSDKHPGGFAVRLHILGDFYSAAYADLWCMLVGEVEQLHVFGFTAHPVASEIGSAIAALNLGFPDRCRIRFSGAPHLGPFGTAVIDAPADSRHILCPVQTAKTDCCGTCGLCWTAKRPIEFVRH